jgi:hypothetical protein
MGEKNRSGVRTEIRDGRKTLVVDFRFTDKDGRESRYRRDASVQTTAGARAEAERLKRLAAERGTLDVEPAAPTLAAFVEGDFTKLVLPRLKPSTRKGYEELLNAPEHGLLALLGKKRLDAIGAHEYRVVEADALGRKVRPRYALVCLRTVLREAHELGALARAAKLPPLPKRSEKLPLPPPEAVVVAVLAAAMGWARVAIALAILAGLRMGEVRALRVCDVNLGARRAVRPLGVLRERARGRPEGARRAAHPAHPAAPRDPGGGHRGQAVDGPRGHDRAREGPERRGP